MSELLGFLNFMNGLQSQPQPSQPVMQKPMPQSVIQRNDRAMTPAQFIGSIDSQKSPNIIQQMMQQQMQQQQAPQRQSGGGEANNMLKFAKVLGFL